MESKAIYKSKTIVSAVLGLLLTLGVSYGVITSSEQTELLSLLSELAPQIGILISLLGAIYGRVKATHNLKLK